MCVTQRIVRVWRVTEVYRFILGYGLHYPHRQHHYASGVGLIKLECLDGIDYPLTVMKELVDYKVTTPAEKAPHPQR